MSMSCADAARIEARAHAQLVRQIDNLWTCSPKESACLAESCGLVLRRVRDCLAAYRQPREFSCLHAAHWCLFLQFMRQQIGPGDLSEKLYLLNRALHAIDMYAVTLPPHTYFEHPVGTVIGRAALGDRLTVLQNVTIGGSTRRDGGLAYPTIGADVIFYAGSAVIGRSEVGDRCVLSAGTRVINQDIPSDSLVFGTSPSLRITAISPQRFRELSPFLAEGPPAAAG